MQPFVLAIHRFLSGQSRSRIITIAIAAVVLLGWLDYWSGEDFTLSFFFLVPILVSTWYVNLKAGHLVSGISVFIWLVVNKLTGDTQFYGFFLYWNAFVRFLFFCLPSVLLDNMNKALIEAQLHARIDFLTGVYNQREFYRLAETEIVRSRRYTHPFAIAYIDIDNFKAVNDRFGHLMGDTLLHNFAEIIHTNIRETDILARLGGDEFSILMPETDKAGAHKVISKLQSALSEQWQVEHSSQTVSIGVVTYTSTPDSVDEMLLEADRAMYSAKRLGKNQTTFRAY